MSRISSANIPAAESADQEGRKRLRRFAYGLMICVCLGGALGRILAVDAVDRLALQDFRLRKVAEDLQQKRAELRARGLPEREVEEELARLEARWKPRAQLRRPFLSANDRSRWCTVRALVEPEMRVAGAPYAIDKVIAEPNWNTIDMVYHDGHLYSSKPPLQATIMAAVYWPIYHFTGLSLGTHPYEIGRFMLVLFNLLPLGVYFVLLAALAERFGESDWGRLFVVAAGTFGTFLTTFVVAINNHLPAAVCSLAAIYAVVRVWFDERRDMRYFITAGLFGGLAAALEPPALALLAAVCLALLVKAPRPTLLGALPCAVVVAAAFFATNWIAHRTLTPPYAHRSGAENWYDYTYQRDGRTVESYWRNPKGLDRGEPSRGVYAFNLLLGHHGLFSLTPVWLLSILGAVLWLCQRKEPRLRWVAAAAAAISTACILFYIMQPTMNRTYGGMTCGPRWFFWLAALWLPTMLPAADLLARRRWARAIGLLFLAWSALSAAYPTWNPWMHPWLMNFAEYLGLLQS